MNNKDYTQKMDRMLPLDLGSSSEVDRGLISPLVHTPMKIENKEKITATAYTEINGDYTYRLEDFDIEVDENSNFAMVFEKDSDWRTLHNPFGDLGIHLAGFCGCACHDEASIFFFKQLRDFKAGKNYFKTVGGLEYFKLACYELDIFDHEFNPTVKGEFLLGLANKLPVEIKGDEKDQVIGNESLKCSLESKAKILALLTKDLKKVIPETINKEELVNVLYFLSNSLVNEWVSNEPGVLYSYRVSNPGEITLLLYWLENVFDLEEHGSSTPGWFPHDKKEMWDEIKSLLNR